MKTEIQDIETHNTDWQKIDYRPFGEQSWTATDGVVRRGFGGDIFDIESGFIRMATENARFPYLPDRYLRHLNAGRHTFIHSTAR